MVIRNTGIFMVVYEQVGAKTSHLANILATHHTRAVEWTHVCPE